VVRGNTRNAKPTSLENCHRENVNGELEEAVKDSGKWWNALFVPHHARQKAVNTTRPIKLRTLRNVNHPFISVKRKVAIVTGSYQLKYELACSNTIYPVMMRCCKVLLKYQCHLRLQCYWNSTARIQVGSDKINRTDKHDLKYSSLLTVA